MRGMWIPIVYDMLDIVTGQFLAVGSGNLSLGAHMSQFHAQVHPSRTLSILFV